MIRKSDKKSELIEEVPDDEREKLGQDCRI